MSVYRATELGDSSRLETISEKGIWDFVYDSAYSFTTEGATFLLLDKTSFFIWLIFLFERVFYARTLVKCFRV